MDLEKEKVHNGHMKVNGKMVYNQVKEELFLNKAILSVLKGILKMQYQMDMENKFLKMENCSLVILKMESLKER